MILLAVKGVATLVTLTVGLRKLDRNPYAVLPVPLTALVVTVIWWGL
jgi:hypothetical protein